MVFIIIIIIAIPESIMSRPQSVGNILLSIIVTVNGTSACTATKTAAVTLLLHVDPGSENNINVQRYNN